MAADGDFVLDAVFVEVVMRLRIEIADVGNVRLPATMRAVLQTGITEARCGLRLRAGGD